MHCWLRSKNSVLPKPVEDVHQAAHSAVLTVQYDKRTNIKRSDLNNDRDDMPYPVYSQK